MILRSEGGCATEAFGFGVRDAKHSAKIVKRFCAAQSQGQQKLILNTDVFSASCMENVGFIRLSCERNLFTCCFAAQVR